MLRRIQAINDTKSNKNVPISLFHSYEDSLTIEYVTKNMDDSVLFKKEIFEKGRRPWNYTFVTKFSIIYFWILFVCLSVICSGILYLKGMLKFKDTPLSVSLFNTWIISTASILFVTYLLSRIRKVLFPVISYKIGEQKNRLSEEMI